MDAIYYDTQSYTTEDVRTRRGVCVRKATKDDDICLYSFLRPSLPCLYRESSHKMVFIICLFEQGFRQFCLLYGWVLLLITKSSKCKKSY